MVLTTSNRRICSFYEEHPNLNFDAINLIFIDLFEKLQINANGIDTTNMQILNNLFENTQQINDLKTSVLSLKDAVISQSNNTLVKFIDIRKDYIEDLKSIIRSNTYENIGPLLEKNNGLLLDKTTLLIHDAIPKHQTHSFTDIHETIQKFHQSISEDTRKLLQNLDGQSIKDFIQNFETKSSILLHNVQQPICSFIHSTEERINDSITKLNETSNHQQTMQSQIITSIDTLSNCIKNTNDNTNMVVLLNQLYTTCEVFHLKEYEHTPVYLMKRPQKTHILFECNSGDTNATTDDVANFTKLVNDRNCHGVYVSHKSGISSKSNYFIEYHRGNIIVYLHNADYSPEKMKIAVDIIDNVSIKLKELNNTNDDNTIPKNILDDINKEYQLFISQKEALVSLYKDCQKKVLSQIDEIRFPNLDKYLSTKYTVQIQKHGFKCDLCKCFNANNLKALAAHKRGCVRKNVFVSNTPVNTSQHVA